MRIIAGKFRGRSLQGSRDRSIRPTTSKIKEYIFQLLGDAIEQAVVLDLFSGSGGLGLESLSRGAAHITFVDVAGSSLKVLKKNVDSLDVGAQVQLVRKDVLAFLRQNRQQYDLIFADPPFKWPHFAELMPMAIDPKNLADEGLYVLENEKSHFINWNTPGLEIIRQKNFDRSIISFMRRQVKRNL